jgi:hypothetical protein
MTVAFGFATRWQARSDSRRGGARGSRPRNQRLLYRYRIGFRLDPIFGMPPLPSAPHVLVIQMKFRLGSANVVSRIYMRYASDPPTRDDLTSYAGRIDATIGRHLLPLCSEQVKTVEVMVTDLTSDTAARGIVTSSQTGTRAGLPNGAAVAALINFKVARRYRGGKPRIYFPFFVSADLTDRLTWSEDAIGQATACWSAFMSEVIDSAPLRVGPVEQVNISFYEGFTVVTDARTGRSRNVSQLRPGGPIIDVITGFSINPKLGSQRRRNLHGRRRAAVRR